MTGSPAGSPPAYPWLAHYDAGVPRTLAPYPHRTLLDYVSDSVRERPQHPAFLFKGRAFTLAELQRTSDAFAAALASLGVKRGDRVAAMLPNCPQFFIVGVRHVETRRQFSRRSTRFTPKRNSPGR